MESLLNQAYWEQIKNIIFIAEDLGLYMKILPICGSWSYFGSFEIKNATFCPPNKNTGWNDWVLLLELIKS